MRTRYLTFCLVCLCIPLAYGDFVFPNQESDPKKKLELGYKKKNEEQKSQLIQQNNSTQSQIDKRNRLAELKNKLQEMADRVKEQRAVHFVNTPVNNAQISQMENMDQIQGAFFSQNSKLIEDVTSFLLRSPEGRRDLTQLALESLPEFVKNGKVRDLNKAFRSEAGQKLLFQKRLLEVLEKALDLKKPIKNVSFSLNDKKELTLTIQTPGGAVYSLNFDKQGHFVRPPASNPTENDPIPTLPDTGGNGDEKPTESDGQNQDPGQNTDPVMKQFNHEQAVYVGNDAQAAKDFESWIGHDVGGIQAFIGDQNWQDNDSIEWAIDLWQPLNRPVFWSIPLIPHGASLAEAGKGLYDDHYTQQAKQLAKFRPQDEKIVIRTGWEFNGDWFPWAAQGKEKDYIAAYQHFVDAYRAVSDRFVFEWNVNMGNNNPNQMNPANAYPGDKYVDIIGMDFYWNTQWDSSDPMKAWQSMRDRDYGLQWHQDFAKAHGKPTSYAEWGVMSDNAGPYIEQAALWFEKYDVKYQTYWNSDAAFNGTLSNGQYPNAATAYLKAFGKP